MKTDTFFGASAISFPNVRIFPSAVLGPEMAAPILWAPGIFGLLQETSMPTKFLVLGGRVWGSGWGQGQKRYPKELLQQRFRRTFG